MAAAPTVAAPAPCRLLSRLRCPLLISLLLLVAIVSLSCHRPSDLPPWFDRLNRTPLQSIVVHGQRIAYLDTGEGTPVILIHGLGGSMWQWEYQQSLSGSHRLITLDFLGAGLSDKPDISYTPDELVDFFRAFMDAVGVSRASLVGNSLGAGIAIGMALAHPDRVDRLVLIGGLPAGVREQLTSRLVAKAIDNRLPIWVIEIGSALAGRGTTRRVLEEMVYDHRLLTPLVVDRSHRNRKRGDMLRPVLTMVKNLPLWERGFAQRIHEIRQPTLIVWGSEDEVFPPRVGRELHAIIAASQWELVPHAGHIAMWEQPSIVNPLLERFLAP